MRPLPRLTLAYLYPRRMNLYADRGNVLALVRRYQWRGGQMDVVPVEVGGALPKSVDLVFMGGGEDRAQVIVAEDLREKQEVLHALAKQRVVMLGICGGYQLFGRSYQVGSEILPGLGLLDVETRSSSTREERMIGNLVAQITLPGCSSLLVGFENHGGQTRILGKDTHPLAATIAGWGNNRTDKTEGATKGTVFGSYAHGSLLPKNPALADHLLGMAIKRHDDTRILAPCDDTIECATRAQILRDVMGLTALINQA